ncbi:MAG TPA: cupin domain-containing protein [Thermoleophilaceae bacterium]|nr:cupin domain-containing protein [Thermoleophilaceae bacterium]
MARSGDVLDVPGLGVSIEFRRTTEDTGGELVEFDVVGRPKGLITVPHVHPRQSERHEVIEGSFRIQTGGLERLLGPGEVVETPAGTPHRHTGDGRVRVQIRPAAGFEPWLERLAALDREGELLPGGWPKPVAASRLLLDFDGEAHGTTPPLRVQQVAARAILRTAQSRR